MSHVLIIRIPIVDREGRLSAYPAHTPPFILTLKQALDRAASGDFPDTWCQAISDDFNLPDSGTIDPDVMLDPWSATVELKEED